MERKALASGRGGRWGNCALVWLCAAAVGSDEADPLDGETLPLIGLQQPPRTAR